MCAEMAKLSQNEHTDILNQHNMIPVQLLEIQLQQKKKQKKPSMNWFLIETVEQRGQCTVALFTQSQWPVSCPPPHGTGEGSFSWHIWRKDRQYGWNLWHDTRYYRVPAGHAPPPLGSLRKPQPVRCLMRGRLWIHQSHHVPYMPYN